VAHPAFGRESAALAVALLLLTKHVREGAVSTKTITPRSRPIARGKRGIFVALTSLVGLSTLGTAGCEATFTPGPVSAALGASSTWVVQPPHNLSSYPHVWYDGRWIYLVDGAWYAPSTEGWIILRDEPTELGRYRRYYEPGPPRRYAPTAPTEERRYRTY